MRTIPNLKIINGKYKVKTARGILLDKYGSPTNKVRSVSTFEEKKSDVNIAINMVSDAYENKFDKAVLISNDTDLVPPMKLIKQKLKKKVWVISPAREYVNTDIARWSKTQVKITDEHLSKSQFNSTLEDSIGSFHKPKTWK